MKEKIDMPARTRVIVVSIVILLSGILFSYCVFCYPTDYDAQAEAFSAYSGSMTNASMNDPNQNKSVQNNRGRSTYRGST